MAVVEMIEESEAHEVILRKRQTSEEIVKGAQTDPKEKLVKIRVSSHNCIVPFPVYDDNID